MVDGPRPKRPKQDPENVEMVTVKKVRPSSSYLASLVIPGRRGKGLFLLEGASQEGRRGGSLVSLSCCRIVHFAPWKMHSPWIGQRHLQSTSRELLRLSSLFKVSV